MKTAFAGFTLSVALIFAISCKSVPSNPPAQSGVTDAKAKQPSATFKADVETDMKFGEVLITGGWQTEAGKRTYLLAYPELVSSSQIPGEDENELIEQKMVLVTGNVIEMTDDQLEEYGFPGLNTESIETKSFEVASVENFDEFLTSSFGKSGGRIMATPRTITLSGEPAKMQVARTFPVLDLEYGHLNPSLSVTFTPEVAEDNESLKLAVQAEWIRDRY